MSAAPFSLGYIEAYIDRILAATEWTELHSGSDQPFMPLQPLDAPEQSAGYLRIWRAPEDSVLDRMIHMRLIAGPVETQLLFVFGDSRTTMPHLHAQVVQFPPDGCVYNMDILPRLDPIDNPEWFTNVFSGLRRPYRKAVSDPENTCAQAPANPALAVYMSPWGIASGRADKAELDKVAPCLDDYLEHYLSLAAQTDWSSAAPDAMAARDQRHLDIFFGDELDPRAWNGVYKIIGDEAGKQVKALFKTPLAKTS